MGDPGPEGSIGTMESANLNKAVYEEMIDLMGAERHPEGEFPVVCSTERRIDGLPGDCHSGQHHQPCHTNRPG